MAGPLFWVPIYIGVPEPAAPDEFMRCATANAADAAAWSAPIVAAYDRERKKHGKKSLLTHASFDVLASERSREWAQASDDLAFDSAVLDKLAAAGVSARDPYEWRADLELVSEYVHMQLLRPAARRRLLVSDSLSYAVDLTTKPVRPGAPSTYQVVEYTAIPKP